MVYCIVVWHGTKNNFKYRGVGLYETIWAALREKVPNVLSRCHTKRRTGARGRDRPSFGMTPTFLNFFLKKKQIFENFFFFFSMSVSYQKKGGRGPARPSFFW